MAQIEKTCEYCGRTYLAFFTTQRFCSRNCSASYNYHRDHPDAKKHEEMEYTTCDLINCQMHSGHHRNGCDALHSIPCGECKFFKEKKNEKIKTWSVKV